MGTDVMEAATMPAAAYHVQRLKVKLASGVYPQEPVSCFCGSSNQTVIVERDRYGVPYRLSLCLDCGLIYANPRMTEAATQQFYREDYRQIYDHGVDRQAHYQDMLKSGEDIKDFLIHQFDWTPTCIWDLGADLGGQSEVFRRDGIPTYQIEIGDAWPEAQPDFVLLNHVLEHVTDLEGFLSRLWERLPATGRVMVNVPGLFTWNLSRLWQSAHTYQFTAESLTYVMECCGFTELHLDERIISLWEKNDTRRPKETKPARLPRRIQLHLAGKPLPCPVIKTFNKFPIRERKRHIVYALNKQRPDIGALTGIHRGLTAMVIGGGPSIDGEVETIQRLYQDGAIVFCIERMLDWALVHGLRPHYVVVMDASDDVVETLDGCPTETNYCVATQCPPAVWDILDERKVWMFGTPQKGIHQSFYWDQAGYDAITILNAGGTVTLAAMTVAMTTGCRDLEIFGFDCHLGERGYAQGIRGVGEQSVQVIAEIEGRRFETTPQYVSFAQQFFLLMEMARKKGMIQCVNVHGDSMVNAMLVKSFEEVWSGDHAAGGSAEH